MSDQLNLEIEPEAGMQVTAEMVGEVKPVQISTDGLTDLQGNPFDPERHQVHPDGLPKLGSKNQLLLKKEAKKSAAQWVKDKVSKVWNGEKETEPEISNDRKIPLSDHELPNENAENAKDGQKIAWDKGPKIEIDGYSVDTKITAEMALLGYGGVFSGAVYKHREWMYPRICQILHEEELRTGKAVPIPGWLIAPAALVQLGVEVSQKDPECKKAFQEKVKTVKSVVMKSEIKKSFLSKLPKFGKSAPEGGAE
jgi:hypothetical protein